MSTHMASEKIFYLSMNDKYFVLCGSLLLVIIDTSGNNIFNLPAE